MSREPHGAYLDYANRITTLDVPHKKVSIRDKTYYFAKMPEGDYRKHYHHSRDQHGYGGDKISFLMEDGSIEEVKGPYSCDGIFEHGESKELADFIGNAELLLVATRLSVGRNLCVMLNQAAGKKAGVVFQEEEFSVAPIADRVRQEWRGLDLRIEKRDGSQYKKVNDYLSIKEQRESK